MSVVQYSPKTTAVKGVAAGGTVVGTGTFALIAFQFVRDQWGLPWEADMDGQMAVTVAALVAGLWKAINNWRKNS